VRRYLEIRKILPEGLYLQPVGRHAADEDNRIRQLPVGNDGTEIIGGVAVVEPGDDVGQRFALVLQVNHVRLGENRTAAGHRCRIGGFQDQGNEIIEGLLELFLIHAEFGAVHGKREPFRLLIHERTRS